MAIMSVKQAEFQKQKWSQSATKNFSLVIFNYKTFMGEIPQAPLLRGGRTSSCALPNSCLWHSVNVQWPYHFPKADDGPDCTTGYD